MKLGGCLRGCACALRFAMLRGLARVSGLVCVACVGAAIQGCAPSGHADSARGAGDAAERAGTSAQIDAANPDPSVRIVIKPSGKFVENPAGIEQGGVVKVFGVQGTGNQLSLYFDARTGEPRHKDLAAYAAWADDLLKEREIRTFVVNAGGNPIREAGLPYVARTYVNVQRPGMPAPTAICDAAGVRFETPGGFWTISCNSDLGKIDEALPVIDEFLGRMQITRMTGGAGGR